MEFGSEAAGEAQGSVVKEEMPRELYADGRFSMNGVDRINILILTVEM